MQSPGRQNFHLPFVSLDGHRKLACSRTGHGDIFFRLLRRGAVRKGINPRNSSNSPPQRRRGAESFLLKQPTVGIAGRLVFGFRTQCSHTSFTVLMREKIGGRYVLSLSLSASPRLFELPVLG